jgi:hypothetical protein
MKKLVENAACSREQEYVVLLTLCGVPNVLTAGIGKCK